MKYRTIILTAIILFVGFAVPAFAIDYTNLSFSSDFTNNQPEITDSAAAPVEFTLSANVGIDYTYTAETTTVDEGYTIVTANSQGTKAYGIQNDFQGVLVTIDDAAADVAAPATDGWTTADWQILGDVDALIPGEATTTGG